MSQLVQVLDDIPGTSVLHSFSSLDTYFALDESSVLHVFTESDLIELAQAFPHLEYPGLDGVDALLSRPEGRIRFTCVDSTRRPPRRGHALLSFLYDPRRRVFLDPYGVYEDLRGRAMSGSEEPFVDTSDWMSVADLAILLSRYELAEGSESSFETPNPGMPPRRAPKLLPLATALQRDLLTQILEGRHAKRGLSYLQQTGFVEAHWPELVAMYNVDHTKDHHPEGGVWQHTLETLEYRKTPDLVLGLGLLLHDCGKPHAQQNEGRMFDRHSQIGGRIAEGFLRRLEFSQAIVRDVAFLVREHMLPSFLPDLPTFRTAEVMSAELFPDLLELYRCDLSSTYRGPDGYYRACKIYRSYLKNSRNPYRTSDGRIRGKARVGR